MTARQHMLGGAIATSVTYLLVSHALGEPATIKGIISAALLGVPAGLALDLLEPAHHPNHRAVAHSIAALAGILALANKAWTDTDKTPAARLWCLVLLAGVASHHALDSTTPAGLPWAGIA